MDIFDNIKNEPYQNEFCKVVLALIVPGIFDVGGIKYPNICHYSFISFKNRI